MAILIINNNNLLHLYYASINKHFQMRITTMFLKNKQLYILKQLKQLATKFKTKPKFETKLRDRLHGRVVPAKRVDSLRIFIPYYFNITITWQASCPA